MLNKNDSEYPATKEEISKVKAEIARIEPAKTQIVYDNTVNSPPILGEVFHDEYHDKRLKKQKQCGKTLDFCVWCFKLRIMPL